MSFMNESKKVKLERQSSMPPVFTCDSRQWGAMAEFEIAAVSGAIVNRADHFDTEGMDDELSMVFTVIARQAQLWSRSQKYVDRIDRDGTMGVVFGDMSLLAFQETQRGNLIVEAWPFWTAFANRHSTESWGPLASWHIDDYEAAIFAQNIRNALDLIGKNEPQVVQA